MVILLMPSAFILRQRAIIEARLASRDAALPVAVFGPVLMPP
jgi:hypothetical protein